MKFLLDADDDWQESFRRTIYPMLHHPLSGIGNAIGIPLFSEKQTNYKRYVGTLDEDEEAIEKELDELAAERNPMAAFKSLPDGRQSEGSWVVLHDDAPELVAEGMQLHLTLFQLGEGVAGREVFAHYEDDWRVAPFKHLRGTNFSAIEGIRRAKTFFDRSTFLTLKQ